MLLGPNKMKPAVKRYSVNKVTFHDVFMKLIKHRGEKM